MTSCCHRTPRHAPNLPGILTSHQFVEDHFQTVHHCSYTQICKKVRKLIAGMFWVTCNYSEITMTRNAMIWNNDTTRNQWLVQFTFLHLSCIKCTCSVSICADLKHSLSQKDLWAPWLKTFKFRLQAFEIFFNKHDFTNTTKGTWLCVVNQAAWKICKEHLTSMDADHVYPV